MAAATSHHQDGKESQRQHNHATKNTDKPRQDPFQRVVQLKHDVTNTQRQDHAQGSNPKMNERVDCVSKAPNGLFPFRVCPFFWAMASHDKAVLVDTAVVLAATDVDQQDDDFVVLDNVIAPAPATATASSSPPLAIVAVHHVHQQDVDNSDNTILAAALDAAATSTVLLPESSPLPPHDPLTAVGVTVVEDRVVVAEVPCIGLNSTNATLVGDTPLPRLPASSGAVAVAVVAAAPEEHTVTPNVLAPATNAVTPTTTTAAATAAVVPGDEISSGGGGPCGLPCAPEEHAATPSVLAPPTNAVTTTTATTTTATATAAVVPGDDISGGSVGTAGLPCLAQEAGLSPDSSAAAAVQRAQPRSSNGSWIHYAVIGWYAVIGVVGIAIVAQLVLYQYHHR